MVVILTGELVVPAQEGAAHATIDDVVPRGIGKGDEGGSGAGHDGRSLTKGGMLSNKVGVPRFSTVLTPFMLHGL